MKTREVSLAVNGGPMRFVAPMRACSGCWSGFAVSIYGDEDLSYCP